MQFKRIYIEISNVCNLRCSFCSPVTRPRRTMTAEEFYRIAQKIKPFTKYVYLHVKGEPLLHGQLKEILQCCTEHGFLVNVTTNGTLLGSHGQLLLQSGCVNQVNISVHSFQEQGEQFQKEYLSNIIAFGQKAKEFGRPYVVYRMWNAGNDQQLDAESYRLLQTICNGFCSEYHLTKTPEKRRSGTLAENIFLGWEDRFVWPSIQNEFVSDVGTCRGARDMIAILCDGTVVPCCLDSDGAVPLGNIFTQTLEEVLSSVRYQALLNGFRNGKITEELCQKCSYRLRFKHKGQKHAQQ